jgi:hypothetical protein
MVPLIEHRDRNREDLNEKPLDTESPIQAGMTLRSMAATSWAGCNPSGPNPDTDVFTSKNGRTAAYFTL